MSAVVADRAEGGLPSSRSRFDAREVLLFVLGLGWALLVDLKGWGEEGGDNYTLVGDIVVGLLMQWTGLLVWRRAGSGRTGPLLYAAGLLWFIGSGVPDPLAWLTFPFRGLYEPLLVAIVVAYPTGRLVRWTDRLVVGALSAAFALRCVIRNVGFDPTAMFGDVLPNPFLLFWDEGLWRTVEDLVVVVGGLCAVAILVMAVSRWLRASGLARRTLTPVLVAGVAIAPLLGWSALTTPVNSFGLAMPDPLVVIWFQLTMRAIVPIAILIGIMRLGSARTSIADLLLDLEAGVPVGRLEEALRRHLRDPSLQLLFPKQDGQLVDPAGQPVAGAALAPDRATRIDDTQGRPLAYVVHDPALNEEPELVRAAGAAARLSLENERLQAEVRAQLLEVRELSARLVTAADAERRRVERDLHDGAQQRLVTLALRLRLAQEQAGVEVGRVLGEAGQELDEALGELRELARGIHPAALTTSGLTGAILALAERSTLPVDVEATDARCAPAVEATAYFVIAEALTNVVRHADATRVRVSTAVAAGKLTLTVADDGVGGAMVAAGTGLSGLRDRVVALGGELRLDSRSGDGTTLTAELPCG